MYNKCFTVFLMWLINACMRIANYLNSNSVTLTAMQKGMVNTPTHNCVFQNNSIQSLTESQHMSKHFDMYC